MIYCMSLSLLWGGGGEFTHWERASLMTTKAYATCVVNLGEGMLFEAHVECSLKLVSYARMQLATRAIILVESSRALLVT